MKRSVHVTTEIIIESETEEGSEKAMLTLQREPLHIDTYTLHVSRDSDATGRGVSFSCKSRKTIRVELKS